MTFHGSSKGLGMAMPSGWQENIIPTAVQNALRMPDINIPAPAAGNLRDATGVLKWVAIGLGLIFIVSTFRRAA